MLSLRKLLPVCIVAFLSFSSHAQTYSDTTAVRGSATHSVGVDLRGAWVVPNKDFFRGENLKGENIDKTASAYLKYAFSYAPDSRQARMFPNTYQGLGVGYHNFFNSEEVGNPFSIYVLQGSRIARLAPALSLDYEWNFGVSFGWKKYDPDSNPYNVVVGSNANAFINFGIMLKWQLSDSWNLTAGIDVTHFSNGNTSSPNAGVNTLGARVGVMHTFSSSQAANNSYPQIFITPHFSYDVVAYGAWRKRAVITEDGGFMAKGIYGIWGLNFAPMYNFNNYFRAGASADVMFDQSANIKDHIAYEADGAGTEDSKFYRPPFNERFCVGLSLRAELVMPIFSINVGMGHNVVYKGDDNSGFYQVVALKTHITKSMFLHVGYRLINFKDPSNLMLGVGYTFHDRR